MDGFWVDDSDAGHHAFVFVFEDVAVVDELCELDLAGAVVSSLELRSIEDDSDLDHAAEVAGQAGSSAGIGRIRALQQ